jgi:DNA replication protein
MALDPASATADTFTGFPARGQATAIPNAFFVDVLPRLTDPVALGVTLFALHATMSKRGYPRFITASELMSERPLAEFLAGCGQTDASAAIDRGLRAAEDAGVFAGLQVTHDGRESRVYFLNAPADRRALEAVRREIDIGADILQSREPPAAAPGIFTLYEQLIGPVPPLMVDELTEAERLYPRSWLEDAFREAAAHNARSWRYVSRILERWAAEGRNDAKTGRDPSAEERYFRGRFGRILRKRLGD